MAHANNYVNATKWLTSPMYLLAMPALVVFVSSNFVNLGNLAFNMVFSRLMGPELYGELALVLTIKLAMLGVFGAFQMATSQVSAAYEHDKKLLTKAIFNFNRLIFIAMWLGVPVIATALWAGNVGARLGMANPNLLFILLVSLPFCGPLCVLRGYAFGKMRTASIVLSANVEMAVRLLGGLAAWQMGLGIEGCVAAIAISIFAGWIVLVPVLPKQSTNDAGAVNIASVLVISAFPFAVLQLAQIASLDGDILLAKAMLGPEQAGFTAALSLFQRIQFYACFALSSVLLPSVVKAMKNDSSVIAGIIPVAVLFLAVAIPFLALALSQPVFLIEWLVGSEFTEASSGLWLACISACAFTLSYMLATLLAALNEYSGIWFAAFAASIQIILMWVAAGAEDASFVTLLSVKATVQGALCLWLCMVAAIRIRTHVLSSPI